MLDRIFKRQSNQVEAGAFTHGNTHLIELRNLVKSYKTGAGVFTALKGVSLNIDSHEFLAIVGKSGSGKSTLINMSHLWNKGECGGGYYNNKKR